MLLRSTCTLRALPGLRAVAAAASGPRPFTASAAAGAYIDEHSLTTEQEQARFGGRALVGASALAAPLPSPTVGPRPSARSSCPAGRRATSWRSWTTRGRWSAWSATCGARLLADPAAECAPLPLPLLPVLPLLNAPRTLPAPAGPSPRLATRWRTRCGGEGASRQDAEAVQACGSCCTRPPFRRCPAPLPRVPRCVSPLPSLPAATHAPADPSRGGGGAPGAALPGGAAALIEGRGLQAPASGLASSPLSYLIHGPLACRRPTWRRAWRQRTTRSCASTVGKRAVRGCGACAAAVAPRC